MLDLLMRFIICCFAKTWEMVPYPFIGSTENENNFLQKPSHPICTGCIVDCNCVEKTMPHVLFVITGEPLNPELDALEQIKIQGSEKLYFLQKQIAKISLHGQSIWILSDEPRVVPFFLEHMKRFSSYI